ncbi:MAG: UDP-N-acetylmuramate dehydrogenase [Muribaculaceae bacterium]|nr:UDP-N-acetylmuramate dehydrogenase [Muribaculaceae bacterium]
MIIEEDKDLTPFTTFNIPVKARYFAQYTSERELIRISRSEEYINNEVLHIGGGSNLLFLTDYNGLVIHNAMKEIMRYDKDEENCFIIADAGVKWTDLVEFALQENLAGLENLAHIPGEVGASAVQNVGAYGVEAKDVISYLYCFDTQTRQTVRLTNTQCRFAYRDSIFKNEWKGRFFILRVAFKVVPGGKPEHLDYRPLDTLEDRLGHYPSIREVADEVTRVREEKLPDPKVLGSAGSFFKNPEVRKRYWQELCYLSGEQIPAFPLPKKNPDDPEEVERVKINSAWLIDQAGLKGSHIGGAKVYEKQPLVIVNEGNASPHDVKSLAEKVIREVKRKFFIDLYPEVNYIDTDIHVTILGSGTSKGIPEVGCLCPVCKSEDPRDKRLRASVLIETNGVKILVDPGPDFRQQAIREEMMDIDAVLVTHIHYDHVGGFDDIRPFCAQKNIPVYTREDVARDLRKHLDYVFRDHRYPGVPALDLNIIDNSPFHIKGIKITPIEVNHGKLPIFGYRIGDFAYITDAKTISEREIDKLRDLKVLIINALRKRDHFAHLTVPEALEIIKEIKPEKAYLTHMCHDIGCHKDIPSIHDLPDNVEPAYDGLSLTIK